MTLGNQRAGGGDRPVAFMINDDCTACGLCEEECPNDAISEGDEIYMVDASKCTECVGFFDTQQCADVCPSDACVADPNNPRSE